MSIDTDQIDDKLRTAQEYDIRSNETPSQWVKRLYPRRRWGRKKAKR